MSLAQLKDIGIVLKAVIARFPVTLFFALLITSLGLIGNYTDDWRPELVTAIMVSGLGLPLSLFGHIFNENMSWKKSRVIWSIIGVFLIFSSIFWYNTLNTHSFDICSAVVYCGELSLSVILISISPYFRPEFESQWLLTFNRKVFTSYVFTGLLALVLYIALSLAILVINNLFDINIDDKIYLYLMVIIAGFIWTLLFLNSIPKNHQENSNDSSPAFRFIIQYIAIPVVIVYAIILVFYASANLFINQQMEEWILWLILWFYILGFLIFCLNYSVKESNDTSWSIWFCKWYLWASIPISLLNIIGLWRAISDQGVVELTYILATFSLFLLISSAYLLRSGKRDFRIILGLLSALILISTVGPFNMCKSTVNSQLSRFEIILANAGFLNEGQLNQNSDVPQHTSNEIRSKLDLLKNRGSLDLLKKWDEDLLLGVSPYDPSELYEFFGISGASDSWLEENIFISENINRPIDIS